MAQLLYRSFCFASSWRTRLLANLRAKPFGLVLLSLWIAIAVASQAATAAPHPIAQIEFIGQSVLPTNLVFQGTPFGGLSGITYDAKYQVYYAISDDRSLKAPARFYTLKIDLSQGRLMVGGVKPQSVTTLLGANSQPFPPAQLDPEGIALSKTESIWISSEGDASQEIPPFVKEFSLTGKILRGLTVPPKFLPNSKTQQGIRNNLAFESLTISPNGRSLFVATENALKQDGPTATVSHGSPVRILQYNLEIGEPTAEFLYLTEPIAAPGMTKKFAVNGLADLLAIDNRGHFISIERSYSAGTGFHIKFFRVSLADADNIQAFDGLDRPNTLRPVQKHLLLDLKDLGIPLDNIEGLTLGPILPEGSPTLIAIADNNFNPLQTTQILAFKLTLQED